MRQALPFLFAYIMPVSLIIGGLVGGAWTFLTIVVAFALLPLADYWTPLDTDNPVPGDKGKGTSQAEKGGQCRFLLWGWVVFLPFLLWWALGLFTSGQQTLLSATGLVLSMGLVSGSVSIVFAHELTHSPKWFERAMAELLLITVTYPHFAIEHVLGHHRYVGTRKDPATARLGEGYYRFFLRSFLGQLKSAWHIESDRMKRRNLGLFTFKNRMMRYGAELVLYYGIVFVIFGWVGIFFIVLQSFVAIMLLEAVNYLEHYGLQRKMDEKTGRHERIQLHHSWNTASWVTNCLLINLGRHSDHHFQAKRPYQALRHYEGVPTLPYGYPFMFILALIPPLWFHVMDGQVAKWQEKAK